MRHLLALMAMMCIHSYVIAQVTGSSDNSLSPNRTEAKITSSSLSTGVNTFTGDFQNSYNFGRVESYGSVAFDIGLTYSTKQNMGTTPSVIQGIPYGVGWSVNLPTISIKSEPFLKFSRQEIYGSGASFINRNGDMKPCDQTRLYESSGECEDLDKESSSYWYEPEINIPGVYSGRLVLKEIKNDKILIFAPHIFSSPLTIELKLLGASAEWKVILPSGVVYHFENDVLINMRNPANQRAEVTCLPADDNQSADLGKQIFPKPEYLTWYCSEIYNPLIPDDEIHFEYEKYGKFDFYKHLNQSEVNKQIFYSTKSDGSKNIEFGGEIAPCDPQPVIAAPVKDLLISRIWSTKNSFEFEYRSQENPNIGVQGRFVDIKDLGVSRFDSMYNITEVERFGGGNGGTNFSGWNRYNHARKDFNLPQATLPSLTNPYISTNHPISGGTPSYWRELISSQNSDVNSPAFDHGFLESPRIFGPNNAGSIVPGDIYEIRTKLNTDNPSSEKVALYDINIATGIMDGEGGSSTPLYIHANKFNRERKYNIFSTFNRMVKWFNMGDNCGSGVPSYTPLKQTSDFFTMPNYDFDDYEGFHIQVGLANSDIRHNVDPDEMCSNLNARPNTCRSYNQFSQIYLDCDSPWGMLSGDDIPNNFGLGVPWYNTLEFYGSYNDDLAYINDLNNCNFQADRFWWNWPYSLPGCDYEHKPTRSYNTELNEVALYRYSKNPYMLVGVKEYVNTVAGSDCELIKCLEKRGTNHCGLKNAFKLEYKGELSYLLVMKNGSWFPGSNKVLNYLLTDISRTTIDGTIEPLEPTAYYSYELIQTPINSYEINLTYPLHNSYRLNEVVNEFGRESSIEYYDEFFDMKRRTPFLSGGSMDPMAPAPPWVQSSIGRVKRILNNSSRGTIETEYVYDQFIKNDYSLKEALFDKSSALIYEHSYGTPICTIKGPNLITSNDVPETIVEYHTDRLKWGKEDRTRNFDINGELISETSYEYEQILAYENPTYKVQPENAGYLYPYFEYTDPTRPLPAGLDETSLRSYDLALKNWAGGSSNIFQELKMPSTHNNGSVWLGKEYYDVQNEHNPFFFKSFFVALKRIKNKSFEDNCVVPISESPTIEFIEKVTNLEYYTADIGGVSMSRGYEELLGRAGPFDLKFDPSWLIFSTKTNSTDMPGVSDEDQNYYYGDLKHYYADSYPYNLVYDSSNWFVVEAEANSAIGVPFQNRGIRISPNGNDYVSSEYYIYEKNLPIVYDVTGPNQILQECQNNEWPCITGEGITLGADPDRDYFLLHEIYTKSGSGGADIVTFDKDSGLESFPEEVLMKQRFLEYHETGQPLLIENEKGLKTKYDLQRESILYKVFCPTAGGLKDAGRITELQGRPKAVIQGFSLPDELKTEFSYNNSGRINNVTDPNGTIMSYNYDSYGMLDQILRNGELISDFDWSLYSTNSNEYNVTPGVPRSIKARAQKNWSSERTYFDATTSNLAKSYSDVNGSTLAMEIDNDMQSDFLLDEYGRVALQINPKDYSSGITPKVVQGGPLLNPDWIETQYDAAPRTRPLYQSPYGEDVTEFGARNFKKFFYCIYLKADLQSELTAMGYTIGNDYLVADKYFHTQTLDEDDKSTREYRDPLGNLVMTLADNQVATFYKYGPQGKLIETQNAKGQITTYEYNQLGLLYKTNSPDKGECQFAYDRSGLLIGKMDAKQERRVNTYDEFNRQTSQQRVSVPWVLFNLFDNKGLPWVTDPGFDVSSTPWRAKEKEWYYNEHNVALNSTIQTLTRLTLNSHQPRAKGRLVQSISYDINENPVEYNFVGYNTDGFISFENNQFNPAGISSGAKGIYMTTDYEGYDRQGNAQVQNMDWGNNGMDFQIFKVFDSRGRVDKVYGNYLNEGAGGHLFAEYDYDDKINKVTEKRYFGSPYTACGVPQVCEDIQINTFDYDYDARHRLIRKVDDLFDYKMFYDDQPHPTHPNEIFIDGLGQPITNYNGNINGISSRYKFSNVSSPPQIFTGKRTDYIYRYDGLNRLVEADAHVQNPQSNWTINPSQLSNTPDIGDASYIYDEVGNLTRTNRTILFDNGCIASGAPHLYAYGSSNNRLNSFTKPVTYSCPGGMANQNFPFTYDANGNINSNSLRENAVTYYMRSYFPYQYYQPTKNRNVFYLYSSDDQRVYKDVKNFGISPIMSEYYSQTSGGEIASVYDYSDESITWYIYGNERVAKVKDDFRICPPDGGGGEGEGPAGEGPSGLRLQPDGGLAWTSFVHSVIQGPQTDLANINLNNAYNNSLINTVSMLSDSIDPDSMVYYDLPQTLYLVEIAGEEQVYWEHDLPTSGITDTIDIQNITSLFEPIKAYSLDTSQIWVNLNDMLGIQYPDPLTAPSNEHDGGGGEGNGGGGGVPEIKPPHGEYFIYDHLGNTRIVFAPLCTPDDEEAPVGLQSDLLHVVDYHPYGKVLREYVKNEAVKFYTTFHERDEESGLDYRGARYYDADVGRFLSVDPLAADFARWSPYNYVLANPIVYIDPSGESAEEVDQIETKYVDQKGNTLLETDDGSNQVFVITDENEFLKDISQLLSKGHEYDIVKNFRIGFKNGYHLDSHSKHVDIGLLKNNYGTYGSDIADDDLRQNYFREGYEEGFFQGSMGTRTEIGQYAEGSSSISIGFTRGKAHSDADRMHAYNPKIRDNAPKYNKDAIAGGNPFEKIIETKNK